MKTTNHRSARHRRPAPGTDLTPRQLQVLRLVWDQLDSAGAYPSVRDLHHLLGISFAATHRLMLRLVKKGYLARPVQSDQQAPLRLVGVRLVPVFEGEQGEKLQKLLSSPQ